jgi:t-SNARE complex subunit (syntaxin)
MQVTHHTNLCNTLTLPYLDNFTEDAVHLEGIKQEQSKHHRGGMKHTVHAVTGKQKLTHQVCLLKILPSFTEKNVNSRLGSTYHILDP